MSDISPQWNPEFFGNTMVVNGKTWPYLNVEQRRYRLRLLNGSQSRFLILKMSNGMPFTQIGSEGGLPAQAGQAQAAAHRAGGARRRDRRLHATSRRGTRIILRNLGPDEPFGGGEVGEEFEPADLGTTGQVMQFRVRDGDLARHERGARQTRAAGDQAAAGGEHGPRREPQRDDVDDGQGVRRTRTATSSSTRPASRSGRRRPRSARGPAPAAPQPLMWMDERHREPGAGSRRELEPAQLHHGRAPDPHPPRAVPGGQAGGHRPDDVAARHDGAGSGPEAREVGDRLEGHRDRLPG